MTYKEHLENLEKKKEEKFQLFLELDKKISTNGFGNMADMARYPKVWTEFQFAHNSFWNLVSFVKMNGINLDDEITPA